jgi:N-methylhydantoinase A
VIPRYPGVAAALGLLATDIRHDLRRSWLQPTAAITPDQLDAALAPLEREAQALLDTSADASSAFDIGFELDIRYRGQAYNLTVPLQPRPVTEETIDHAVALFEDQHRRLYDYTPAVTETEIVTLRVRALARIADIDWAAAEPDGGDARIGERQVWDGGWRTWRTLMRDALATGTVIEPETIIEQEDTTVVVPARWRGAVAAAGTLVLNREAE